MILSREAVLDLARVLEGMTAEEVEFATVPLSGRPFVILRGGDVGPTRLVLNNEGRWNYA